MSLAQQSASCFSRKVDNIFNFLSSMKSEDYVVKGDVMETAPKPTLFCICCLEREDKLVSLLTCSHADFLNSLLMPEIKPQNQVVCYQCHENLKKIKLFKLQVKESFKLLSDKSHQTVTENTPKSSNQRNNFKIRQVYKIDIPQTNFNNIENPQTIQEDANTDLDVIIKKEKECFDNIEKSPPANSLQTKKTILEDANTDLDVIIKEEKEIFDNTEKSLPANGLQTKKTILKDANTDLDVITKEEKEIFVNTEKTLPANSLQTKRINNIEAAIRIINNNQNSDCINFLATSLQSLSHSILSDIYTNFELGSQNDTNPTEIVINADTAPTNNIATDNSSENVTNNLFNKNHNTIENIDIMNEDTINRTISENANVVENAANEELKQSVTEKNESMDVCESNNMQTDEILIANTPGNRTSLSAHIKQLTLTREQLMQEREKIATSQSYLRAPHRCESCLIGFQFEDNLKDHVKRKHTSGKRYTIKCDVCLQYVDYGARNTHLFWHHTRYECIACAEKFASYEKAVVHYKKKHQNVRSSELFKCPHCPYKTGRKSYFTDHLKTKCKSCGVAPGCASGIKLKVHMRKCVGGEIKTRETQNCNKSQES